MDQSQRDGSMERHVTLYTTVTWLLFVVTVPHAGILS